jgi:poly(A) polymerase
MTNPGVKAILDALCQGGVPARFVGGCVRDAIAGLAVSDIDVATPLPPSDIIARLEARNLRAIPTGIDHGTITALAGHGDTITKIEVTTLRIDVETDGRYAKVEFTTDWLGDAARRDFTFNALYCDQDGTLYDPFEGQKDLREGRVRFIGRASDRIAEDRLRILRFFRFYARFGKLPPDTEALSACTAAAGQISLLSGERVRGEILKLLGGPRAAEVVRLMSSAGILHHTLEFATNLDRLDRLCDIEIILHQTSAIRRLAALLPDGDGQVAAKVGERLRLSNAEAARLKADLTEKQFWPTPTLSPAEYQARLYRWGNDIFIDRLLLAFADKAVPQTNKAAWHNFYRAAQNFNPPTFPLKGEDALALGLHGPEIGKALRAVEDWWVSEQFIPDYDACLAELKRFLSRQ